MKCCETKERSSENKNIRYKRVKISQITRGIKFDITSMDSSVIWYEDKVSLCIRQRGCSDDKGITYECYGIQDNTAYFLFDQKFYELCRGRYEGIVTVGCKELICRLDFNIGQNLCFDNVDKIPYKDIDPKMAKDPDCCEKCEEPKPCGCFDASKQTSMGCSSDEKIEIQLELKDCDKKFLNDYFSGAS